MDEESSTQPWVSAHVGHALGLPAPGEQDWALSFQVAHHLLLAHGLAVPVLQRRGARVGITLNLSPSGPGSPSEADRRAVGWTPCVGLSLRLSLPLSLYRDVEREQWVPVGLLRLARKTSLGPVCPHGPQQPIGG